MKLLGALVCAATLVCVTSSPLSDEPRAASCTFTPNCDNTGEELVPIPCEGFCSSYFLCKDGKPASKSCDGTQNFNNILRKCDSGFKDCDWWKEKTTPNPDIPGSSPTSDETTTGSSASTSAGTVAPTIPTSTEGPCHAMADCDATGEEKKPIPCASFCNKYYDCKNGTVTVKICDTGKNFDYLNRECSSSFKKCDWYKQLSSSSTHPTQSRSPATPSTTSSTSRPTTTPAGIISSTTKKTSQANSVFKPTISLLLTVVIPLLSRYL